MIKKILCLALTGVALTVSAADNVEFNRIAQQIALNSLAVKASRLSAQNEAMQLKSENNLADPEVEFGYLWGVGATDNKWNISVSQSFDWPGVYAARRKAIAAGSKAIEESSRASQLSAVLEAKLAMIDAVNAYKVLQLCREMNDTICRMYDATKVGVENGEVSILDLNKMEIERVNSHRELGNALRAYEDCASALRTLNGGNECGDLLAMLTAYPDEMLESEESYLAKALADDPQVNALRMRSKSDSFMADAVKRMNMPGFSVGYTYEHEVPDRWHGITVGLTLPFFSNRHKAKAARLQWEASGIETQSLVSSISSSIVTDCRKAALLQQEIATLKPVVQNEDNYRLLFKALKGGQISLIEYLQEAHYFLQAYKDFLETEYLYALTLARLNRQSLLD